MMIDIQTAVKMSVPRCGLGRIEVLGEGGFATVYRAKDKTSNQQQYALKHIAVPQGDAAKVAAAMNELRVHNPRSLATPRWPLSTEAGSALPAVPGSS